MKENNKAGKAGNSNDLSKEEKGRRSAKKLGRSVAEVGSERVGGETPLHFCL